jgi:hypothetical protein
MCRAIFVTGSACAFKPLSPDDGPRVVPREESHFMKHGEWFVFPEHRCTEAKQNNKVCEGQNVKKATYADMISNMNAWDFRCDEGITRSIKVMENGREVTKTEPDTRCSVCISNLIAQSYPIPETHLVFTMHSAETM